MFNGKEVNQEKKSTANGFLKATNGLHIAHRLTLWPGRLEIGRQRYAHPFECGWISPGGTGRERPQWPLVSRPSAEVREGVKQEESTWEEVQL